VAKRLTDSRKWDDPWFIGLETKYQLLWIYLLDKCNHIGLYKPALSLAGFLLHDDFIETDVLTAFNGRIVKINDNWWIPKFICFQYGSLKTESRMHLKVLSDLKREIPKELLIQYRYSIDTLSTGLRNKDKDKDKDKEALYKGQVLEFFEYFCLKTKKNLTLSPARSDIISARLKTHKIEQLKLAVDNFIKDDWPDRHKFMDIVYCIGIRNKVDNLERWLNWQPKKQEFKQP